MFAREIAHPGEAARLAAETGAALTARGYHAQVAPQPGSLSLFHMNAGRATIKITPDGFQVGNETQSRPALERAQSNPAEFSPNVLLRPIVQDTLFPTVCYVAGPSELAYLGQLRRVSRAFDVPMPLIQQRATATIVDSNAMRFLSKHDVPLEALRAQDEAALNELLSRSSPRPSRSRYRSRATRSNSAWTRWREGPAHRRHVGRRDAIDVVTDAGRFKEASREDRPGREAQGRHASTAVPSRPRSGLPRRTSAGARDRVRTFLNNPGPALVDRLLEALPPEMGSTG